MRKWRNQNRIKVNRLRIQLLKRKVMRSNGMGLLTIDLKLNKLLNYRLWLTTIL